MNDIADESEMQKQYYNETAGNYENNHVNEKDEHYFALTFLNAAIDYLEIESILDIGTGTGRAIRFIKKHHPKIRVVGIEPVQKLREIGYSKGLSEEELIGGDATNLEFRSQEFDLVCEFGVLHHIKNPEIAVSEMLRVADKAIFISDSNNFGQGSKASRFLKQLLNLFGLWHIADLLKTGGKGYHISEGDGLFYSYSVFNNYEQIQNQCQSVHMFNTKNAHYNFYRTASHVALLGIK